MSEKPVHSRRRRLVDWINLTGAKKVHSLIDKVYKGKNREMAWEKVKANRGSGGVDGQNREAFEAQLDQQLDRLQRELKEDAYQPQPVRQHPIQKRDKPGEYRMLGIPTIYDRVCQQALLHRLEPIFEPVFDDASFGYRRGRSTKDAMRKIWKEIQSGSEWIVDADLRDFFGSVDHEKLLTLVAQRVADGRVLRLIEAMLKAGSYGKGQLFPSERGTPQGGVITPLTQKVTLAVWPTWRRTAVLWGARWYWDAVTNGDGVVPHQDVFDHEPDDSLALRDIKRLSGTAQACEERRESLRQSQEGCPIVGLVSDRLQFSTKGLFTLAQRRHSFAQLLDRQECFLVGVEKSFHAFANMRQLSLQTLFTFLGRIARARCCQPAVKFLLDQRRIFQESDHLRPDDLIEEILSDQAAVVAYRTAQFSPAIGANTFVVVDLACARAR